MEKSTVQKIHVCGFEKAFSIGEEREISVRIKDTFGFVDNICILFNLYGQKPGEEFQAILTYDEEKSERKSGYSVFTATIKFETAGYRTFFFEIILNGVKRYIKYDDEGDVPALVKEDDNYPFFDTFAYEKDFSTPSWVKGGTMYQIYIDTFNSKNIPEGVKHKVSKWEEEVKWKPDDDGEYRNDKFFGGNLEGIIEKLPYLSRLGVTIIYLTPIFKAESSNRYDIIDYEEIDPMVGDWDLVARFCKIAHSFGIRVVQDIVFNHCNPKNKLFVENRNMFTGNFWWGFKTLVEFCLNSEDYRKMLRNLLKMYLKFFDGIRLDVADSLSDEVLAFIRTVVKEIEAEEGKEIWILGEVWKNDITGDYRKFLYGNELDSVMNYGFSDAIYRYVRFGDYGGFKKNVFKKVLRLYPKPTVDVLMNPLSTHDIPRIPNILTNPIMIEERFIHRINGSIEEVFLWDYDKLDRYWYENGEYSTWRRRQWEYQHNTLTDEERSLEEKMERLCVFLQFTLPGVPSIFAGDEMGAEGLKDPFNRMPLPWNELKEGTAREDFYVRMGAFRKEYKDIFAEGECELVHIDERLLVYRRKGKTRVLTFILDRVNMCIDVSEGKLINL